MPVVFPVVFTQAARAELIEAQDWYEGEATGLGRRFRQAIDILVERMSSNPQQFPYSLFFVVEDETLLVIACFHTSRDPLEWQKRT